MGEYWVVKMGPDSYWTSEGVWRERRHRRQYSRGTAYDIAKRLDGSHVAHITVKPRRTEATIRREERERIAAALKSGNAGQWLMLGDRVLIATTVSHPHPENQARDVLLAFDWPEKS